MRISGGMISLRIPIAAVTGATLTAWRAVQIAEDSSLVQAEMTAAMMIGVALLVLMAIWEAVRALRSQ